MLVSDDMVVDTRTGEVLGKDEHDRLYPKSKRVYWVRPKVRKPKRVQPFMTFDVETYGLKAGELAGTFALGVVYWQRGAQDVVKVFYDRDDMVDYLLSPSTPKRCFGWNIKYDGFYVLSSLNDAGVLQSTVTRTTRKKVTDRHGKEKVLTTIRERPRAELIKHQGHWLMLTVRQTDGEKDKLSIIDACNSLGVGTLDHAIKAHKIKFTKIPIDYANVFPGSPDMDTVKAHCINDAKATYELMKWYEGFWVDMGVKPGLTRYSTSLELLKSRCLNPGDVLPTMPRCFNQVVRPALRGGRCQVFRHYYRGEVYYYDINRLYPSMYRNIMPLSGAYYADVKPCDVEHLDKFGFIQATVYIPRQDFPPLPYVGEEGRLDFPGQYKDACITFTWWTLELQQAIRDFGCTVLDVREAVLFDRSEKFLAKFADETEALKRAVQNKGQLDTVKHVANGLWGKFAEKDEQEHVHFEAIPEDHPIEEIREINEGGEHDVPFWVTVTNVAKGHHLPHIAAAITAYGRMRLVHDMNLLHKLGYKIFYCDTDSVFTDKPLPPEWVGIEDGKYKLAHTGKIEGIWLDKKVYAVDGLKPRAKAFPGTPSMDAYRKALVGDVSDFKVKWMAQRVDYTTGKVILVERERGLKVGVRRVVSILPSTFTDDDESGDGRGDGQ